MELNLLFTGSWKKIEVATNETKKSDIIILEEQKSFLLTKYLKRKGVTKTVASFCVGKFDLRKGLHGKN